MKLVGRCATCVIRSVAPVFVFAFSTMDHTATTDNQDDFVHGWDQGNALRSFAMPPLAEHGEFDS
jgi:hypothetical protein